MTMKKLLGSQRFLVIYSGIVTLVFAVTILSGFAFQAKKTNFEELNVQRINVVEPDGTLRMVISNKAAFPGIIIKGQDRPHPNRKTAGMLFFNDEGTENGGLIFGGEKDKDGTLSSYGHLSFDEYEKDQVFTIDAGQHGNAHAAALKMVDNPDYSITELLALTDRIKALPQDQQNAEVKKFTETPGAPHQRLFLGKSEDKSIAMKLKDVNGRDRMVIAVEPDGSPVIRFLDQDGKVVSQLPQASK
jgi:hypothetical protein